jgi:acetamidase/formamidase
LFAAAAAAAAAGDGVHIMTGPIYVCDAAPGDVLQVRNSSTGQSH